jgi:phosphoglycerate dehydrogenase-like enzyme
MAETIVISPAIDAERLEVLRARGPEFTWVNAGGRGEVLAAIPEAVAFLGKITPEFLGLAPRLRWVQAFTASLEHYIFPELVAHDCVLTNTRGLFGDVIADQVMGYVLCFARNLHIYVRQQIERRYEPVGGESARVSFAAGPGTVNAMDRATTYLPGSTLGIVGFGEIGQQVARRAGGFGMRVLAVDRFPDRHQATNEVAEVWGPERLDDLLGASDFVVIAAPQTPETTGLFNAERLSRMKRTGILINVGRGAIVVLADLVDALRGGVLAGAALDVFEIEPLPADQPLWSFPNVILTPHTAGYSPVIAARHLEVLADNVARFAAGEELRNVVDKSLWF